MGAYLSSPVTEKISSNGKCDMFVYGASSMQGWRMSQEDAHNCLVDFDKETGTSLFAVYDGHGGAEVAQYTADRFPGFLKSSEHYLNSDLQKALEEGFLDFDGTLVGESVIQELKQIAGLDDDEGEDEVCMPAGVGRNEADVLRAEANMPLEELLEKYENYTGVPLSVRSVKKKEQILSPVIKPKRPPVRQQEAVEADSNSNSISDVTTSNSSDDAMSSMCSFDQKMANGCADNENNLNFEKEFMEKKKTECLELNDKECIETVTASCDTDYHKTEMKPSVSSSSDSKNTSEDSCDVKSSEEHVSSSSSIKSPSSHSKDLCDTSCHSDSINTNSNAATDSSVTKCEQTPSSSSGSDQISENNNKLPNSSSELKTNGHSKSTDSEVLKEASEAEAMCCSSDNSCENVSEAGPSCSSLSDHSCSSALKQNGTDAVSTDDSEAGPSCSSESRPYGGSDSKPDISEAESSVPGPSSSSKCIEESESSCGSSTNQSAACSSQEEAAGPSGSGASEHIKPTQSVEDDSDESVDDEDDDYEDSDEYIEESDDDDEEEEEEDDEDDGVVDEMDGVQENLYRTDDPGFDSGCTAVVALLRNNQLIVANAGDSRCVLSRGGKAVDLSVDHKPEDDEEQKRIEAAGGNVTPEGRVNGGLNLSRAIGDHCYKQNTKKSPREQMITALPDIESCTLNDTDEFVIIACDGIWNYMSSQEVVDYVRERLKDSEKRDNPALICEELFDHCLAPNTTGDGTGCDNMTCIILAFHKNLESNLFDTLKRKANDPEMSEEQENNPEKKTKLSDS